MNNDMLTKLLVLDDKYGKINSHWAYSTDKIMIVDRIYYDEDNFEMKVIKLLTKENIDAIGFSGRNAPVAAAEINNFLKKENLVKDRYNSIPKLFKLHNTNLMNNIVTSKIEREHLMEVGNDWVRAALSYPFDYLLVQTYGDCDVFNHVLHRQCAYWVPYCYNDELYFPRNKNKDLDIGAFFKLERHDHRIAFVKKIQEYTTEKGYSFEFSDQYWGETYAEQISRAKILVHLSYCGDVPWRLYECAATKTCLLTDPLGFKIEKLFDREIHYAEYQRNFSDLESKIDSLIKNNIYRENIIENAYKRVQKYTWRNISASYILPLIQKKYV